MKYYLTLLGTLLLFGQLQAQSTEELNAVKNLLLQQHPDLDTKDKIIAFNVWSASDKTSRECNQAFEKVCATYQHAKLQGGRRGVIVLLFNRDQPNEAALIALNKDQVICSYSLNGSDLPAELKRVNKNRIYTSLGETLYSDLSPEQIFSSVQSLITR